VKVRLLRERMLRLMKDGWRFSVGMGHTVEIIDPEGSVFAHGRFHPRLLASWVGHLWYLRGAFGLYVRRG